jgi:peroxiredoxin
MRGSRALKGDLVRRAMIPLLTVAAIAFTIWWLEYRPRGGGEQALDAYGPVDLPPSLATPDREVVPREGALAPDFLLPTLEGKAVRLSDLRGKGVVINFWATWCPPCRKEMPQLVAAYQRYRKEGLEVVAVNVGEPEGRVRQFAEEFGMEFTVALDKIGAVARAYSLLGLPTTFFVDRQGVIRMVHAGAFKEQKEGLGVQEAIGASELEEGILQILR